MGNEAHEKTCRYHSSNLSPEQDYELDEEGEYDSDECDDEADGTPEDDETDRRIDPSPLAGIRTEGAEPNNGSTPIRHLARPNLALDYQVAAHGVRLPDLLMIRDTNMAIDRDRTVTNNPVRDEPEGSVVGIVSVMRDLRRPAVPRMPQR